MPIISALWEAEAGGSHEVRCLRPAWPTWWNPVSTKNTKISQAWWLMPVIPATLEAEAGELLEPRRWGLQWAETMPLHSSLGDTVRLHLKKKKKKSLRYHYPFFQCVSKSSVYFTCRHISVQICCLLGAQQPRVASADLELNSAHGRYIKRLLLFSWSRLVPPGPPLPDLGRYT